MRNEQRRPTAKEQAKVAQYIGFGDSRIRQKLFPVGKPQEGSWAEIYGDLENLLTDEEMAEVKESTQYAHYTSKDVVQGVWSGLNRLGATRGIAFEAGVGSGNFIGMMPADMQLRYQGVEREPIAAGVARALYPDAGIIKADFRDVALVPDHYDVLVGNPPFSNQAVRGDKQYEKYGYSLHNYFIAKQIDALRPGGVGAFVVSHYLMDAKDGAARKAISDKADLIGAVRLPKTAFKQNAGTDVVTDILFFKRRVPNETKKVRGVAKVRVGEKPLDTSWTEVTEVQTTDGPATINTYFARHPDMVLGENSLQGSMTAQENEYTVLPREGQDLGADLGQAVERLPEGVYSWNVDKNVDQRLSRYELAPEEQEGAFYVRSDGTIWQVDAGVGVKSPPIKANKARTYLPLKKAVMDVFKAQANDEDSSKAQAAMLKAWKAFVKKHGPLSQEKTTTTKAGKTQTRTPNESALSSDPEFYRVQAIEDYDALSDTVKPNAIFTEKVIGKEAEVKAESAMDAMAISMNKEGVINMDYMREIYPVDETTMLNELGDSVFKEPISGMYVPRDQYLSGNVRAKLAVAKDAAKDTDYERNVKALEDAQPETVGAGEIYYPLAAQWIPENTVQRFAEEVLDFTGAIRSWTAAGQGGWTVQGKTENDSVYGTARVSARDVLEAALQQTRLKVTDQPAERGQAQTVNKEETLAANIKVQELRDGFDTWVKSNAEELDQLSEVFNMEMNVTVPWAPDGSHLTFPGFTSRYTPHPWQKNLAWRFAVNGNTYAAHAVGAGKTLGTVMTVMESRRLGLIKKAVIPVPKSTLSQWRGEWLDAYPNAKLLVIGQNELNPAGRRKFWARAAMQDWDGIIVTHDAFKSLGLSPDTTDRILSEDVRALEAAIDAAEANEGDGGQSGQKSATRSQIEKAKERIEDMIAAAHNRPADSGVTFEDTGIDLVVVDEAHTHKKMGFATEQSDIKGVNGDHSEMGLDLFSKARYLREVNPKHSLMLLSGTPITNSIGEIFQVQRLMQPDVLERMNAETFDSWSASFATTSTGLAMTASGDYKTDSRMIEVRNRSGLVKDLHAVMDVVDMDDLVDSGAVNLPQIKGGQREIRVIPSSADYAAYQAELGERIAAYAAMDMKERRQKGADNIPWIMSDGSMAAIDLRLVDRDQTSDSKVVTAAKEIAATYKARKDDPFNTKGVPDAVSGSVQLVFSDKWARKDGFSAADALIETLVSEGVPRNKILNVSTLGQDERKRKRTWRDANMGKYAVLIGGTKTLGTGVNVQKRAYAVHHLDAPLVPADIIQREGRIIRNGNQYAEKGEKVEVVAWGKEGSIESFNWQLVEKKQRMIDSAMNKRDLTTMVVGDLDSDADQMAMAMAMVSGDPRVLERAGLQADVRRYEAMQSAHYTAQADQARKVKRLKDNKPRLEKAGKQWRAAADKSVDTRGDKFKMTVGFGAGKDRVFTSRSDAGQAFIGLIDSLPSRGSNEWNRQAGKQLGTLGGQTLVTAPSGRVGFDGISDVYLPTKNTSIWADIHNDFDKPLGAIAALENGVRSIARDAPLIEEESAKVDRLIERKEAQIEDAPAFTYAGELKDKKDRLAALDAELAPPEEETETGAAMDAETDADNAMRSATPVISDTGRVDQDYEPKGVPIELVKDLVSDFGGKLLGLTAPELPVRVFATQEQAFGPGSRDKHGRIKGAFLPKTKEVILIAENLDNLADARTVLRHEVVGHYGTQLFTEDQKREFLKKVADAVLANRKLGRIKDEVLAAEGKDADPMRVAEEIFARVAEEGRTSHGAAWDRLLVWLRGVLRNLGLIKGRFSLPEMRVEAETLARGIREGQQALLTPADDRALFSGATTDHGALPDTIDVDGVMRPTANSEGRNIHPTEVGVRNFWRWFGDSEVVDEEGRPLVVYHGTRNGSFNAFDLNAESQTNAPDAGETLWFSSDRHIADGYARQENPYTDRPRVFDAYIKVENPYRTGAVLTKDEVKKRHGDGYDSLITEYGNGAFDAAVFAPTQIKSATGNTGAFDPTNPDIRYSRTPTGGQNAQKLAGLYQSWLERRKMPSAKNLSVLNRTIGTPYHIAQTNRNFKVFHDSLTKFNETRDTAAHNAQSLAPNLFVDQEHGLVKGWNSASLVRKRSDKKEMALIEGALNELVETDSGRMSNRNFTEDELRARGFTDEMIGTYHQMLRSAHYSLDLSGQSLQVKNLWNLLIELNSGGDDKGYALTKKMGDIAKKIMVENGKTDDALVNAVDILQPYIDTLADKEATIKDQRKVAQDKVAKATDKQDKRNAQIELDTVEAELQRVHDVQERIGQTSKKDANGKITRESTGTLGAIEGVSNTVDDLVGRSYFPLMRFGRYTLTVWDENNDKGDPAYFARYETEEDQKIAAQEIEKKLSPTQTMDLGMANEKASEMYAKINMDTIALFADHIEAGDKDGESAKQVDLLREYIRIGTADNSALKQQLHREGTPGWSEDVRRVLASYILSNAGMTSSQLHMADINGAIQSFTTQEGDVQQYAQELRDYTQDPGEEMSGIRNFMFFWYLGGSIASAAVNLTQVPMVTFPYLSQFSSAKNVAKHITDAYRTVKGGNVGEKDTPLGRSYKQAELDGIIAPQQIYTLMGTARGGSLGTSRLMRHPNMQFAQQLWGGMFGWAEQVNRSASFIAAFNLAMEGGKTEQQAFEFAKDSVDQTQFVYNKTNRPAWARGIAAPVFTFKTFLIQYMELLYRLPKKQKLQMLGLMVLASGIGGLPGEEDAEDIIDTIMQIVFGKAWQTRDELKKFTEDVLGETFGEIAMEGISAAGLPIDLQRLGMGDIAPGTSALLPGGAGQMKSAGEILGPTSGLIKDAMSAVENIGRGDFAAAGKTLVPKAVRNAIAGVSAATSGNYTDTRGRNVMPVSFAEAMAKAIGFQPRRVAEHQEQKWSLMKRATLHRTMEDAFLDRMARARVDKDPKALQAAKQEVRDWNKRNPDDKIEYTRGQINTRVKGIKAMSEDRFLKSLPKELRDEAMGAFGG